MCVASLNLEDEGVRCMMLEVTPQFMVMFFSEIVRDEEARIRMPYFTGMPEDVKVVRAGYDNSRDVFFLVIESGSFEPVTPGSLIPKMTIMGGQMTVREVNPIV